MRVAFYPTYEEDAFTMPFQYKFKESAKLPSSKVTVGPGQTFFKHDVQDGKVVISEVEVLGDWYKLTPEDVAVLATLF